MANTPSLQERKERLLDQLDNTALTEQEIERIRKKLALLDEQAQRSQ